MAKGLVQARIDNAIKEEAAAVLATIGLSLSDAVRLMLMRVVQDKALPFNPLIPNSETIAAMEEARAGNLPRAKTVKELFEKLNADG
ncbi:MAG: type II toxin-antitoxin system RelB/DinJ family antitoxin [Desulfovibrio sp.]|jgi:DNA-damage-inducible protein J|nr:type II toxin-antitoxin system RelB/DinJ family antitoxin [Desulfovibrio sp.]